MQVNPFEKRRVGILLHPTSLPGKWGNGDFGRHAYRFVDFLASAGQTIWQILPLGPTHHHSSPYQCLSVHAGNPQLINLDEFVDRGWLQNQDITQALSESNEDTIQLRYKLLNKAYQSFVEKPDIDDQNALTQFIDEQRFWLEDYALYMALRKENKSKDWSQWPDAVRDRDEKSLRQARKRLDAFIQQVFFEQFFFYSQWNALKKYANERNILIFGDMPIFVAFDSVDVWVNRQYFQLDETGKPTVVTGVPPDYFSATGQRWGNPQYHWENMQASGFSWWHERIDAQLQLFDLIRIDHFRGFESYWEIPAEHDTAIDGRWVAAPGDELLASFANKYENIPFVAEDLGIITDEVTKLRDKYSLPGMKVLHFAFDGSSDNPYLPHNHERNSVVYTGTHDNDTTQGWYESLSDESKYYVNQYLDCVAEDMPWALIKSAFSSVANTAIIPMQDIMNLGTENRMNVPGTSSGNWRWRFNWDQLDEEALISRLRHYCALYGRLQG
ncbi:MAG: 4-alpha-glucanotransferase [Gammaproteobacteria bacterium]